MCLEAHPLFFFLPFFISAAGMSISAAEMDVSAAETNVASLEMKPA